MAEPEPRPIPERTTVVERDGRTFWILGTAHVSKRSVEDVEALIDAVEPDIVCVELDKNRYEALVDEEQWRRLDIFQVLRQRRVSFLLAMLVLSAHQARIGERFGVRPGAEMLAAVHAAKARGVRIALVDRDIQITIRRTWRRLGWRAKLRLLGVLVTAFFSDEEITEEDLERIKGGDELDGLLAELARQFPGLAGPLIAERDVWMAHHVRNADGERVVAVVGAAHVPGILAHFDDPADTDELGTVPPRARWVGLVKWILPAIVLSAFALGFRKHAGTGLVEMLWAWILPNALFAALFSLVAGARLVSALTAFVASPITSLNPTIAAGMVVGLVEAWLRRPTVEDCARVREDAQTLRGWYRNRFTRVLLVSAAASLGSAVGAWVGGTWVVTLLGR